MQGDVCEMGLFINEDQYPELFKNTRHVQTQNQRSYRFDDWTEFLKEQKRANQELNQAFLILNQLHQKQASKQEHQWQEIGGQIGELRQINFQREAFEKFALELLEKIEQQQREGVELEEKQKREIFEQIEMTYLSNGEIRQRLEQLSSIGEKIVTQVAKQELSQEQLSHQLHELQQETVNKLGEQETKQQTLDKQMEKQDARHQELIARLEKQEAVSEKIIREIQHIRSVLFERASYLAEKIENGYKLTSSYFQKIVHGSNPPSSEKEKVK